MKVTFKGNIGKDAELRTVQIDGLDTSVCSFWVAENIGRGEKKTVHWHKVTLWRNYARVMAPYLKTGRRIEVSGVAKANSYTTKDNRIVPYIDIQADEIELLDRPQPEGDTPPEVTEAEVETPWGE